MTAIRVIALFTLRESLRRRVFEPAGREEAPRIVRELVESGEEIYGVRVLRSSLEDAYLEAVGES